jgi:hypothetical protein
MRLVPASCAHDATELRPRVLQTIVTKVSFPEERLRRIRKLLMRGPERWSETRATYFVLSPPHCLAVETFNGLTADWASPDNKRPAH